MGKKKNILKRTFTLIAWVLLLAGNIGGLGALQQEADVLNRLSLEPAAAKASCLDALASGSVYHYEAAAAFKALPLTSRAAIVRAGLGWVKSYVGTAEFKAAYQELRNVKKPQPPAARPQADEQLKKQKADFEKQIAETRKNMAGMDPETRKALEQGIKDMRAQLEAMEKDPEQKKFMSQMDEQARSEDKKKFGEQLKSWNEIFPADPQVLVKKRINDFLAASADVDFSAKLTQDGNLMRFVKEEYERKSSEWKTCFRAGKEATEAGRAFAKAWLAELEKL